MKIEILGTKYTIIETDDIDSGNDGECNFYSKIIRVRPESSMLVDGGTTDEKRLRYQEVMRHEIIHAFFYESGLTEFARNEELVDWITSQIEKINEAVKEAEG